MSTQFHKLKIASIEKPIKEASTITLNLPEYLYEDYRYFPGQHLIIRFRINGKEVRRTYSLNSCPFQDELPQITVKRVKGGLVSNYINDQLKVGDELEVMLPQGRFYAAIKEEAYKTYFLFAAGSGITPIISILKSVLVASPDSRVCLLYGNTHQNNIIFKEELEEWQHQFPQRLTVVHTLSDPLVWTSWEQWKGEKGRIDSEKVEWFIDQHPPIAQSTEYYICGPGAMNLTVRKTLIELGIPKELIHIEQFGGIIEENSLEIDGVENAQLTARLNEENHQLLVPKGQTILQVLKAANVHPPYSCESGVCATCVARITHGKVSMKVCMALEDKDIEKGLILTCQAVPITKEIGIDFEK